MIQLRMMPGTVVVFEGLDKAGKSTQIEGLRAICEPEKVTFAHMPSGFSSFTAGLYSLLEDEHVRPSSGLAQQLAHLACHSESMPDLVRAASSGSLVLDRWWWSTLAYGWFGGSVAESGLGETTFRELVQAVWAPLDASVVFVFLTPHERDENNVVGVEAGYRALYQEHSALAVVVPLADREEVEGFIVRTLVERGLAVEI